MRHAASICCALLLYGVAMRPALAGPPFVTDDPEPTEFRQWEIYNFIAGTRTAAGTDLGGGLDLNYGASGNLQLTAVFPLERPAGEATGAGDVELAAKFRLPRRERNASTVDVAVFPRVFLPTSRGARHPRMLIPVWAQRDLGAWSLFGGGGFTLNPGTGNRHYWSGGVVANRRLAHDAQLGIEYFTQGPTAAGETTSQLVNVGTSVHLAGPCSLLASAGRVLGSADTPFYVALKLQF